MARRNLVRPVEKPEQGFFERLFRTLEGIMEGRTRNYGTFTLTASVGSTTVSDARFESHQSVVWSPTTANASAEIGAGTIYVSTRNQGSFVITHANNAQVDRTFLYVIVG
jgi:hypothetical protein